MYLLLSFTPQIEYNLFDAYYRSGTVLDSGDTVSKLNK